MNRVENSIQGAVILWVKDTYPEVIITATANEKNYKETKQIGSKGIPDLLLFHPDGYVFFLELKTTTGGLLQSQKNWNDNFDKWIKTENFSRNVAYGLLDAKAKIEEWIKKPLLF